MFGKGDFKWLLCVSITGNLILWLVLVSLSKHAKSAGMCELFHIYFGCRRRETLHPECKRGFRKLCGPCRFVASDSFAQKSPPELTMLTHTVGRSVRSLHFSPCWKTCPKQSILCHAVVSLRFVEIWCRNTDLLAKNNVGKKTSPGVGADAGSTARALE